MQPKNTLNKPSEFAIRVQNVSKAFRIPHEKIDTLKGAFVSSLRKKTYEEFKALDDVSFEVKKGEFFGIIWRNGSGKSTLLKILSGIYRPDRGRIKINGRISPFLELGIGFNPELSGRDNIYLNASVLGLSKKQIDQKFDEIVAFSELSRFIDQKLKNYSSGMQVRLAFSVSIHANRDILLMDEVLAVGDANFQVRCLEEFLRLREMGKTVILVTHNTDVVQRYCDRVTLLKSGKIKVIGDPEKVARVYMLENMSDEELRLVHSEKLNTKKEEEKKSIFCNNKFARVLEVKCYSNKEEERKTFKNGDIINIDVAYEIVRDLRNPIFGITILNGTGQKVFVTNTERKKVMTGKVGSGKKVVRFVINNYFSQGTYTISPAIASEGAKIMYDWKDNAGFFRIFNDYFASGLSDFKHEIIAK